MAVSEFLEDLVSHLPALQLLQQLGYQYLSPREALKLLDGRRSRVVLESILFEQLRKLNQITFKGQTHDFTETNLKNAVDALVNIPFDGLVKTNEQAFDLLTLGKAQGQTIDGNKRSYTLQYIDWEHPENNVYHIADEFEVERTALHELRRPDIVLFVNGIPLAVIECKRPDDGDARQGIVAGTFDQESTSGDRHGSGRSRPANLEDVSRLPQIGRTGGKRQASGATGVAGQSRHHHHDHRQV